MTEYFIPQFVWSLAVNYDGKYAELRFILILIKINDCVIIINIIIIDSQIVSQCPIVKQKWKEMMDSFIVKAQVGTKKEQREKLIQFYCYFS